MTKKACTILLFSMERAKQLGRTLSFQFEEKNFFIKIETKNKLIDNSRRIFSLIFQHKITEWKKPTTQLCYCSMFRYVPSSDSKHNNRKRKLECAVDGAPSQIPTLKFLTPQHPKVPPLGHDPGNKMKIPSNLFSIFSL